MLISIVTIQVQVQVQSHESKGLGVTLFCFATTTKTFLSNQTLNLAQIFTEDLPDFLMFKVPKFYSGL